ncbi:MAG: RNA polymerase subunit sigma-70 [Anaerotignum sp.]|nr:RNA polymerase subunit sigma-70 [Anaerotignum sp.]
MEQTDLREQIKNDLTEQLERNGTVGQFYQDLILDYMKLWDVKNMLIVDIDERGAVVNYVSNTGQANKKKNDSVMELIKVNDRMVKLLDAIGITPAKTDGDANDEM